MHMLESLVDNRAGIVFQHLHAIAALAHDMAYDVEMIRQGTRMV